MTRQLFLSAVLAGGAALAQQGGSPKKGGREQAPPKSKKLSRAEFDQLLAKPKEVLVIDVRRPDELTAIGGFPVYLSIQLADLGNRLEFIPKDRTLITVSNHANRGLRAADLLDSHGFKVAGAIGAQDYEAEGGKLLKLAPPSRPVAPSGDKGGAQ